MRAEDEVGAAGGPLLAGLAVLALKGLLVAVGRAPRDGGVEEGHEELVGQLAGVLGEDTLVAAVPVGVESAQTAEQDDSLGDVQSKQLRPVDEHVLGADAVSTVAVVAEAVGERLEVLERLGVSLFLGSVGATRCEWHGCAGRLLQSSDTSKDDQVGHRDLLVRAVEVLLDLLQSGEHLAELTWVVDLCVDVSKGSNVPSLEQVLTSQFFCGSRRIRAPLAPPRLSPPRNVEALAKATLMSLLLSTPKLRMAFLS